MIRRRDVKLRRHCPLCGKTSNLEIDKVESDLSYAKLSLRCPSRNCTYQDVVQIFLNVDFSPRNERVQFESQDVAFTPSW
jgi:hypothetical protein